MEELQIAINENLKYQKKIKRKNYTKPELFNIINDYISKNGLICYGGMAINMSLPKDKKFYRDNDVPDYDFFSNNAIPDIIELTDIIAKKYHDIEVKSALNAGTYKIFVNFAFSYSV